jgi:arylsulfatase A-like enzyme
MAGRSDRGDTSRTVLLAAITVALATAALELTIVAVRRWMGHFVWSGNEIIWMTPLGYVLMFVVPALFIAPFAGRWRRLDAAALAGGIGVGLGAAALIRLLSYQRVHIAAILLLGMGLGVRAGLILHRMPLAARTQALRRVLAVSAVALLGACSALYVWQIRQRSEMRADRAPLTAGAPNVLLLILDTVRAASLSLYGHTVPTTPRLEQWARRGVVFENAIAASSWTLPSHSAVFTGRFAHELSADWLVPLDRTHATLAEVLRARGYRTGGFVANPNYASTETGLSRGFERYRNRPVSLQQIVLSTELGQWLRMIRSLDLGSRNVVLRSYPRKPAEVVNAQFLDWIDEDQPRPFFAFLNYMDAHMPYHAPDSVRAGLPGAGTDLEGQYDVAIRYLDGQIHSLLTELEGRGLLRNTLVIITSDHGEEFGTHGLRDHGTGLYLPQLQVPLVVLMEGEIPAGLRVKPAVTLRNVAATVLDLAGGERPAGPELPGRSWARFWNAPLADSVADDSVLTSLTPRPRPSDWYRNAHGEVRSVVRNAMHYISNPDGTEEVYDIRADRWETRNLIRRKVAPPPLTWMRNILRSIDRQFPRELPPDPS